MPITNGPAVGVATTLKISQEGAARFFVGLGWNPAAAVGVQIVAAKGPDKDLISKIAHYMFAPFEFFRVSTLSTANLVVEAAAQAKYTKKDDAAGRDVKSSAYDLDLDCYIFDSNMKFRQYIGTENNAYADASKKVYHTGDDQAGSAGPDDEQVFVETKGLPEDYHHLFFVVKCDSKYAFAQYDSPSVRLVDSKSEETQLECRLAPVKGDKEDKTGAGMYNYIFCHVFRDGAGWKFESLDRFVEEGIDWENALPKLALGA